MTDSVRVADRARWRREFDRLERALGERLEAGIEGDSFQDWLAAGVRVRADLEATADRFTSWCLHRVNLPSHSDVAALTKHLARIEQRVRDLDVKLDAAAAPPSRRRSRNARD